MLRRFYIFVIALALIAGCKFNGDAARVSFSESILSPSETTDISSDVSLTPSDPSIVETASFESFESGPLEDFNFAQQANYLRIGLDACLRKALTDSPVVRELGGLILRAPDSAATRSDPALAYVDPRFGEEAALSQFDATWNSRILFQKNDGLFNNLFIGDEGSFQKDLANYKNGVQKLAATGGQFELNHVVDYEKNNSPSNRFNGNKTESYAFDTFLEAGFRQPLLQGSGVDFNRIAGPNNQPGVYNGVLISRANTDMALADFQMRVRDLISDVENAYWDLFFAYRDLEAKVEARNGAYDIWRNVEANKGEKSAAIIGQAKEQYYRFAAEVEDAIHGRLTDGTRTNNGSSSGTFRRAGGVRTAERRLRLITGMKLNDGQLIVPSETPVDASTIFDWPTSRQSALSLRPELRRQKWKIKRRELELLASKNHLLPRLDVLGKYRIKGFGHDLFGDGNELNPNGPLEEQLDSSAFGSLNNGNLQEWELGVDMSVPLGFRQGHVAKRHAELNLSRDRAILKEQERQIIFGLSNAMGELVRTTRVRAANLNRLEAANEQFDAIQNIWREQDTTIDLVLEAQRRVIEAKLQYFQTQVEYMLALKAVHFEEGTLFDYHNVILTEAAASRGAAKQSMARARSQKRSINYWKPGLKISNGPAATAVSTTSKPMMSTPIATTISDGAIVSESGSTEWIAPSSPNQTESFQTQQIQTHPIQSQPIQTQLNQAQPFEWIPPTPNNLQLKSTGTSLPATTAAPLYQASIKSAAQASSTQKLESKVAWDKISDQATPLENTIASPPPNMQTSSISAQALYSPSTDSTLNQAKIESTSFESQQVNTDQPKLGRKELQTPNSQLNGSKFNEIQFKKRIPDSIEMSNPTQPAIRSNGSPTFSISG